MDGDRAACRWLEQFNKRRDADHKRNARRNAHHGLVQRESDRHHHQPKLRAVQLFSHGLRTRHGRRLDVATTASATVPYTGTITASGGSGSGYSWTVTGLSDGLSYTSSGATLTISGTPTSAATVTVTASVKDSAGNAAGPSNYTITVYGALTLPTSNPATLGPAIINTAYTGTIVASGGSGNYSWTVTVCLPTASTIRRTAGP